jgi:hypothetical protein
LPIQPWSWWGVLEGAISYRTHPPSRVHHHRYHGVLAPSARLWARVVALDRDDPETTPPETASPEAPGDQTAIRAHQDPAATVTTTTARSRWARLLAHIYEVFPLRCPECGSDMRILAFFTDPQPVRAILCHLELPHIPPRLSPAQGPPQPAFDLDADPVPELHLDQTREG